MLRQLESLKGYSVEASDGRVGEVRDFYFDDEKWTVRHLVVDTGGLLRSYEVLVSPLCVSGVDEDERVVRVSKTKEEIENAPSAETDRPVSRQFERSYYDYYGAPYYWVAPHAWGVWAVPMTYQQRELERGELHPEQAAIEEEAEDAHLHSFNAFNGYDVEVRDGSKGDVEDLIIDSESWSIRYIVVDTAKFLPAKDVLVAPQKTRRIDPLDAKVYLDLTKEELGQRPEFTSVEALQDEPAGG